MSTLIHRRVEAARRGENPYVVRRLTSGWLVMGDVQFLEGYCLLLPDPVVSSLNSLQDDRRREFLFEMSIAGDAILKATDAYRINYEILGNTEAALHAHIFPRFKSEPAERRARPVWFYDRTNAQRYSEKAHGGLKQAIRAALADKGV